MSIRRVGIIAKQGLVAASEHVARVGARLRERGVDVVYDRDTAALAGAAAHDAKSVTRDALPRDVDLVIVDADGKVRWGSAAGTRLLGHPSGDTAADVATSELVHPDDLPAMQKRFQDLVRGTPGFEEPTTVRVRDALGGRAMAGRDGHPIRVRIGLNSGEVLRESGTLYGTAVNAAARVSAKAKGGQILVSQITRDLTSGVRDIAFVDRGMFTLKGFPTQWRLSEVVWNETAPPVAEQAAPAPRRTAALEETFVRPAAAPMVGRQLERAALEQDLAAVVAGSIRVFAIEGEPGIGKTRLMESAVESATEKGFGAVMVGGDEELRGPFFMLRTLLGSTTIESLADKATARDALEQARGVLWGRREADAAVARRPLAQFLIRLDNADHFIIGRLAIHAKLARMRVAGAYLPDFDSLPGGLGGSRSCSDGESRACRYRMRDKRPA